MPIVATDRVRVEMGVKNMETQSDHSVVQTVEILKRPGQSLGFYIREGDGSDRADGVFISRIAPGSIVESNGLLRVGDEILTINSVNILVLCIIVESSSFNPLNPLNQYALKFTRA